MIWLTAVEAESLRYRDKKERERERSIREGTSLLNKIVSWLLSGRIFIAPGKDILIVG
jgi:hypothetical protein